MRRPAPYKYDAKRHRFGVIWRDCHFCSERFVFESYYSFTTHPPTSKLFTYTAFGCSKCVKDIDNLMLHIEVRHERDEIEQQRVRKALIKAACDNPPPPPPMRNA